MAKFLTGNKLNAELDNIIQKASSQLVLISPYIKLHERLKSSLISKIDDYNLEVFVLFGKNKVNLSKSINKEDFNFLKNLPNIKILHEERLHAKYYANESKGILSSMNLYDFSQNNNIEAGVLMESSLLLKGLDDDCWEYFQEVIKQSDLLFKKTPLFEKKNLISNKYIGSEIEIDNMSDVFVPKEKPLKNKYLKTKDISNKLDITSRTVNSILVEKNFMYKKNDDWFLTEKGISFGGVSKTNKFGKYIVWSENILEVF